MSESFHASLHTAMKARAAEILPEVIELRRTLNIAEKDPLEIYVDGDSVILRKHEDRCIFCESKEHILAFQGKHICLKCLAQLKKAR